MEEVKDDGELKSLCKKYDFVCYSGISTPIIPKDLRVLCFIIQTERRDIFSQNALLVCTNKKEVYDQIINLNMDFEIDGFISRVELMALIAILFAS